MAHKSGKASYPAKAGHPGRSPKAMPKGMPKGTHMMDGMPMADKDMPMVSPPKVAKPAAKRKK